MLNLWGKNWTQRDEKFVCQIPVIYCFDGIIGGCWLNNGFWDFVWFDGRRLFLIPD